MAPRSTRTTAAVPATPAASTTRRRSKKRGVDKAVDCPSNAASPVSVPAVPLVELMSDDDSTLVLPIRFQCPLCFDVLRRPIQLPCCQRHLCEECLKRGLEITSSNCGFCRKRIVGMARKKQYKVDDGLWNEIRRCCPFVAHTDGDADCVVDVEFVDENAPSKQRMVDAENEAAAVREAELTLSQKNDSQNDGRRPTLTIAVDVSPQLKVMRTRSALGPIDTNVAGKHKQQRRLESFFGLGDAPSSQSSRPSSAGSTRSLRSTTSSSSNSSTSSRGRVGKRPVEAVGKKPMIEAVRNKPLLRSSSHSPKRRKPQAVQRTLLQLTIHSPVGRATRQSSSASVSSTTSSKGDRPRSAGSVTTRPRRPWRCGHCTYENTCFDTRCSMCQRYPAHAPVLPL